MADLVENGVVENVSTEEVDTQEEVQVEAATEKTFTQAELDEIVQKEKAKARRSAEREFQNQQDEAKKLAAMNDQEKAEHERKKLLAELQELKDDKTRNELTSVARTMLSEADISLSDELLKRLVTLDAEETKEAVTSFISAFKTAVSAEVKKSIRQDTPAQTSGMSKQTNYGASLAKTAKASGPIF